MGELKTDMAIRIGKGSLNICVVVWCRFVSESWSRFYVLSKKAKKNAKDGLVTISVLTDQDWSLDLNQD